jgi:hypothetical protein
VFEGQLVVGVRAWHARVPNGVRPVAHPLSSKLGDSNPCCSPAATVAYFHVESAQGTNVSAFAAAPATITAANATIRHAAALQPRPRIVSLIGRSRSGPAPQATPSRREIHRRRRLRRFSVRHRFERRPTS